MLKRTELRHLTTDILKKELPNGVCIYDTCDLDIDSLGCPLAINVKTLSQNSTNVADASAIPLLESRITLQLIVYCQAPALGQNQVVSNYGDVLDELCEKVQWALLQNKDFLQFGTLESFNTKIDDGTGANTELRDGGALLEFSFRLHEAPCKELVKEESETGLFRTMVNTFEITGFSAKQKISLMDKNQTKETQGDRA